MRKTHGIGTNACTELLNGEPQKLCLPQGSPLPSDSNPLPHLWHSNKRMSIVHVASTGCCPSDHSTKVVGIAGRQHMPGETKCRNILRNLGINWVNYGKGVGGVAKFSAKAA